jgi:5'-3' exoribonuclease 1
MIDPVDHYLPPVYKEQPDMCDIGDRVINLNSISRSTIPFGLTGTVVGILESKFEILFDTKFIGGNNLGGKCSPMRGAVLELTDFFNISKNWFQTLISRDSQVHAWTWDCSIKIDFKPQFKN